MVMAQRVIEMSFAEEQRKVRVIWHLSKLVITASKSHSKIILLHGKIHAYISYWILSEKDWELPVSGERNSGAAHWPCVLKALSLALSTSGSVRTFILL